MRPTAQYLRCRLLDGGCEKAFPLLAREMAPAAHRGRLLCEKAFPLAMPFHIISRRGILNNRNPRPLRKPPHRRWEIHMLVIHHKTQDSTTGTASETVERLPSRIHME